MAAPRGQAHGKTILIGEHAVVHGVPAIAIPVGLDVRVELGEAPAPGLPPEFVAWFRETAEEICGRPLVPAAVGGDLPRGVGLGSSAALAVASLRALSQVRTVGGQHLLELADAAEAVFHGNPSGLDVRTVLSDDALRFVRTPRGPRFAPITGGGDLAFDLWIAPPGPSTAAMVARVAASLDAADDRAAELDAATAWVAAGEAAFAAGDAAALGRAMDGFQGWLARHGASTPLLDDLCARARAAGAAGAKLTGAGGGGAVLVLWRGGRPVPEARPRLPAEVAGYGFELRATGRS